MSSHDQTPLPDASPNWISRGLAAAALVAAVWIVYGRSLDAPFICDDYHSVLINRSIKQLWPLVGQVEQPGPFRPARYSPTSGRPLVNLTFALNYQLGELNPRGYHIVNVVLHSLNVLLFALLALRVLQMPYFAGRFDGAAGPLAFSAALLWAVHPLVTEAVVYVTQRTELLVSFCYLATLYASLRFFETRAARWGVAAAVACWAGMASKEIMATAPVMVLMFDRTFFDRSLRGAWQISRLFYVGLFSSWLLLLCLNGTGPRSDAAGFHLDVSAVDWWLTQSKVLLMYLRLALWPWPLAIHYEPPYLSSLGEAWPYVLPVALLVTIALLLLWRRSAVGYAMSFALAILAPTLLVPIISEIAAERRMYLPLAALVTLAVGIGFVALRRWLPLKTAMVLVAGAASVMSIVAAFASATRLATYQDTQAIWEDVIAHYPQDATAQYNVGTGFLESGDPQKAIEYFRRAIEIRPSYAQAYLNLGAAYNALGRKDEAIAEFRRSVEVDPSYAPGHVKLGVVAMQENQPEVARRAFEAAIRSRSDNAEAHRGLADALLKLDKVELALHHAETALYFAPDDATAHNTLGAALAQQQRFAEAVEHFEAAVRLDPGLLEAQGNLMAAYANLGRTADAVATAERALAAARVAGDAPMAERIAEFLDRIRSSGIDPPAISAPNPN